VFVDPDTGEEYYPTWKAVEYLKKSRTHLDNLVDRGFLTAYVFPANERQKFFLKSELEKILKPRPLNKSERLNIGSQKKDM
jgi:hypothetical protein